MHIFVAGRGLAWQAWALLVCLKTSAGTHAAAAAAAERLSGTSRTAIGHVLVILTHVFLLTYIVATLLSNVASVLVTCTTMPTSVTCPQATVSTSKANPLHTLFKP